MEWGATNFDPSATADDASCRPPLYGPLGPLDIANSIIMVVGVPLVFIIGSITWGWSGRNMVVLLVVYGFACVLSTWLFGWRLPETPKTTWSKGWFRVLMMTTAGLSTLTLVIGFYQDLLTPAAKGNPLTFAAMGAIVVLGTYYLGWRLPKRGGMCFAAQANDLIGVVPYFDNPIGDDSQMQHVTNKHNRPTEQASNPVSSKFENPVSSE